MNLNKKINSIVITYEDGECVRLSNEHAIKFQDIIRHYISIYQFAIISDGFDINEKIDITKDLQYEIIRNGVKQKRL